MANEMRNRLVELLEDIMLSCKSSLCVDCEHLNVGYPHCMGVHFADHLIENGVIVPPCKVGQTVYRTSGNFGGEKIYKGVIDQIGIYDGRETRFWVHGHPLCFACADIGKTVFLTKAEAEQKLKEMRGEQE